MSRTFFLHYPSSFVLFHCAFILPCILAKAIPDNYYITSINSLLTNECEMPKEVFIPFQQSTSDPDRFSYLSTPLKECQTVEAVKENEEAHVLCKDIFKVLKDITCDKYNVSLPNIKSSLPSDACSRFFEMRDVVPRQEEYLARRLIDRVVCNLICKNKYETLCKTLAWSYDVRAQIESVLENKVMDGEKGNVSGIKDTTDKKENEILAEHQPDIAKTNTENNLNGGTNVEMEEKMKNPTNGVNANNVASVATVITKTIVPVAGISSNKNATDFNNNNSMESGAVISTNDENSSIATKVINDEQNTEGQVNRQLDLNSDNNDEGINHEENTDGNVQPKEPNLNDKPVDIDTGKNSVNISESSKNTDESNQNNNQNNLSGSISQNDDKNKDSTSNNNIETSVNPGNSISSKISLDNDLNTGDFQGQESESKVKEKPVSSKSKNTEKVKDADPGIPNAVTSDAIELTTLQVPLDKNDENDQAQEDKDQEQYNDTGNNESDYSKAEYENTFSQPSKDKDSEVKNTANAAGDLASFNGIASNYESYLNPRNNHEHDDVRIISTFPEQEDSHFFFYFLSIVFILMAGYLIFHNKQKIIALIVEGRHERRRRSHGAGYKKLETK